MFVDSILIAKKFIPQLMEMHQAGHFPIERLCKVYPVENLKEAIRDLLNGQVRNSFTGCDETQWLTMIFSAGDQASHLMGVNDSVILHCYLSDH